MKFYAKNIPVEFHPDPIWNDGALDQLKSGRPNRNIKMKTE